ncbi:sodium/hydrogen exchanger 9B2-like isoform X2 [Rhodnius prolixus]
MPDIQLAEHYEELPTSGEIVEKEKSKLLKLIEKQCYLTYNMFITLMSAILFIAITWMLLYLILHQEVLPSGDLFRLAVLVIVAYIVGIGFTYIQLPALLGMLITGVVLKTVGFFHLSGVYSDVVIISRNVALSVILIKAGLGLDATAMRKLKFTVLKLAVIPCCAEAIAAAILAHFIIGFPWLWAFLLGFLLSPISPAVVVPTLLNLKERGYGEDKGVSTLVIAASSIDDIFSISAFGIFLSSLFSKEGNLVLEIIHGPLEVVVGLLVGIVWGFVAACFPHRKDPYVVSKRTAMIGIGGLCAVIGSNEIGYPGSGPLACITGAFVAAISWKIQGWDEKRPSPVANIFSGFWIVMQPILFSLIGTEIDLYALLPNNVGYGIAVVLLSLCVRILVCFLTLIGGNLNFREIIFVNFAWLPKATVQAALSPQALDVLSKTANPSEEDLDRAKMLITTAVLAIIITAPAGAIAIALSGPRLLSKTTLSQNNLK